ncbi:MAG: hypothetical protein ACXWWE_08155 [Nitrospira sp.]
MAASQECGGADLIARNPALTNLYEHCVAVQLGAIDAQEAAYERGQADVVAGLSKAVGSAAR